MQRHASLAPEPEGAAVPAVEALLSPPRSSSGTHPPVERSQRGAAPRVHSGKFPGSSRQGIKAREGKGAASPAPAPSPPASAMKPHLRLLLLLLAVAALCQGAPLAGELRCRCVRTVSEVIPPRRLARLEFLAEGPHCAVPEVIATLKQGQLICLDPAAPWVKLLVTRILRSSSNKP